MVDGHADDPGKDQEDGDENPWKGDADIPLSLAGIFGVEVVRHVALFLS